MNLGDVGKWRKSKVESFIRRHLNVYDLGMTRYYEMCMWDNKGTLLPRYAILMDNSIVLTENPPKTVVHTIPLGTIRDISLIADRHSLIKGKNNSSYICQHISITYDPPKKSKSEGENSPDNIGKREGSGGPTADASPRNTSPLTTENNGDTDEDRSSVSARSDTYLSGNLDSRLSDISASPSPSLLNESVLAQSILNAYEPTLQLSSNIIKSLNEEVNNSILFDHCDPTYPSFSLADPHSKKLYTDNTPRFAWNEWLSQNPRVKRRLDGKDNFAGELSLPGGRPGDYLASRIWMTPPSEAVEKRSATWSSGGSPYQPMINGIIDKYNRMAVVKRKGLSLNTPNSPIREINDNFGALRQRRPKTVDPYHKQPSTSPSVQQDDQIKNNGGVVVTKKKAKNAKLGDKMNVIHLYFYQRDSEFLNELSLLWNRQQLKNTETQEGDVYGQPKTLTVNKSLRAAEKIVSRVAQDWCYFETSRPPSPPSHRRLSEELGYVDLLRKVAYLHKCLMRFQHLKYLCWKNRVIMSGLVKVMLECLEPMKVKVIEEPEEIQEAFIDKITIYAILMDIFRSLYEACGVSWFKEARFVPRNSDFGSDENLNDWETDVWDYKLTIFDVTRKLLSSVLLCPFLPATCEVPGARRCLVITDPQKFVKVPWLSLRDENSAKIVKLVGTAHNASVALLFELLAIVHFLPTIIEKTLVTCGIQQMNLERFIRLSVTQIINLLWSNRDPMNASQTMLLYRQVWNLRSLLKHDRKILDFIRTNFCEEFQYYVHTKGIKSRIPDQYTIKPKVIDLCEQLCEDIVGKPGNKS